jgi:hypothetical protein
MHGINMHVEFHQVLMSRMCAVPVIFPPLVIARAPFLSCRQKKSRKEHEQETKDAECWKLRAADCECPRATNEKWDSAAFKGFIAAETRFSSEPKRSNANILCVMNMKAWCVHWLRAPMSWYINSSILHIPHTTAALVVDSPERVCNSLRAANLNAVDPAGGGH